MIVVDAAALVDALTAAPGSQQIVERLNAAWPDPRRTPVGCPGYRCARRLRVAAPPSVARRRRTAPRAFSLRDSLSADDAAYVALAEALDCSLLTRDARLARSSGHGARITFC